MTEQTIYLSETLKWAKTLLDETGGWDEQSYRQGVIDMLGRVLIPSINEDEMGRLESLIMMAFVGLK